ncbi:MAG: hypothetical protein ACLTBX_00250 [Clostridia bacterium]
MIKSISKIVFVIIGALIGAGFASGQEIYVFFYAYGMKGIIGIIISSTLIGYIIYKTFKIIQKNDISTYREFLEIIIGRDKKNLISILNIIINTFLLVTFFIMISGFGAYFEQQLGINSLIGSAILAILCYIIFMTSTKGVVKVSTIIVPFLIFFIIYIGIEILGVIDISKIQQYTINNNNSLMFILKSILYSSYNSILLIPVLITLKDYLKNSIINKYASILITVIVATLSMILFLILSKIDVNIEKLEMPAVYLVSKLSNILATIYGFIILSSIFTTSISVGNSFIKNICEKKKSYQHIALIMCITSVFISKIGFSNLVQILYPFFGYLGIIQIVKIVSRSKT